MDEEYWAYLARNVATGYHFPLIGGNIGGTGWHTTPWLVYLLGGYSFLTSGDPLSLGLLAATLGVITTLAIYLLGQRFFTQKVALLAAFFYASSASIVFSDRRFWNPMVIPLFTVVFFYLHFQRSTRPLLSSLFLGLLLSLFFAAHGLAVFFLLFFILLSLSELKKSGYRFFALTLTITFLSLVPLLVFEKKHDFIQTKRFLATSEVDSIDLTTSVSTIITTTSRFVGFTGNPDVKSHQTFGCPTYPPLAPFWPGVVLAILVFLHLAGLSLKNSHWRLFFLFQFFLLIALVLWPEGKRPYYLAPLSVIFSFAFASLLLSRLRTKALLFLLLFGWFLLNVQTIASSYHSFSYASKLDLAKRAVASASKPFTLALTTNDGCQAYGYRYLFTYLNREPVSSYADPYFRWLYEDRLPKNFSETPPIINLQPDEKTFSLD